MLEQNGIKYGIIAGLALIISTLLLYFIDAATMIKIAFIPNFAIYIFCMSKSPIEDKKADGGFITFRNAFQSSFIVFVVASFFYTFFFYVLISIIDPSLIDVQMEVFLDLFERFAEWAKMGDAEFDEIVKELEKINHIPSFVETLQAYLFGLIRGAIPALIIAAIVKKEKPLHLQGEGEEEHLIER